jgi:Zn finger protein HypA/HybF involved in hydrogenase expression
MDNEQRLERSILEARAQRWEIEDAENAYLCLDCEEAWTCDEYATQCPNCQSHNIELEAL